MTREEAREEIQELLKQDPPEIVAGIFVRMYLDDKLEFEDLEFMVGECGFDITPSFREMTKEEQRELVNNLLEEDDSEEVENDEVECESEEDFEYIDDEPFEDVFEPLEDTDTESSK